MTESIKIRNYDDTLYFSHIDHDTFCEYRLPGHGLMWVRSGRMEIETKEGTVVAKAGEFIFWQRDCSSTMKKFSDGEGKFADNKQLVVVDGANHCDLYDGGPQHNMIPWQTVDEFFAKYLR